ncbi:DUF736 family protein [Cupriavidus necator]
MPAATYIGAAWKSVSQSERSYPSVTIGDPSLRRRSTFV